MTAELQRLVRFGLVGVVNTLLTLMAYLALTRLGVAAAAASALGFALGATNSYLLNRSWTFHSALRGPRVLARYLAVQGLGAGLSAAGVAVTIGALAVHRLGAEALVIPPVTLITYLLSRTVVFVAAEPVA